MRRETGIDWTARTAALLAAAVAATSLSLVVSVRAQDEPFSTGAAEPLRAAAAAEPSGFGMREGAALQGPRGYYALCARRPELCPTAEAPGRAAVVQLAAEDLTQLERFNASVNARYRPMTDIEAHGVSDLWMLPTDEADCEDYVLAKRAALMAAGWPPEALLIGVVVGRDAPYHAVLILRTNHGELVLDNLTNHVLDWRQTGYEWVIRQSKRDPATWVRVDDGADHLMRGDPITVSDGRARP